MADIALMDVMLTYLRGRFELVSDDNERYRLTPETVVRLLAFFDLMEPWTRSAAKTVAVGPYHVRMRHVGEVSIPLELADRSVRPVPVSIDWLRRMRPLFLRALELIDAPPDIGPDFSLAYGPGDEITVLPPDRITHRPADLPPE